MTFTIPQTAMLFAAGLGKRMLPLTATTPKPLVEVAGKPLIARSLDMLEEAGVKRVVVNTHHLAEKIEAYLGRRVVPEIKISYEEELLETGGGIVHALPLLGDTPFFAVNSDVILLDDISAKPALHRLAEEWQRRGDSLDILLLLYPVEKAVGYNGKGDFFVDKNGIINLRKEHEAAPFVFTGIQILHPRLFAGLPTEPFSLSSLFTRLVIDGNGDDAPRIRAIIHSGEWLHVGDIEGIRMAEAVLSGG